MDIRQSTAASAARSDIVIQPVRAPSSAPASGEGRTVLEPAAQVEISDAARSGDGAPRETDRQFARDLSTNTLVYQVFDPSSGEVLSQLPDEATMKARAFARELASRIGEEPSPSTVAVA